jgi:hypothetical protein
MNKVQILQFISKLLSVVIVSVTLNASATAPREAFTFTRIADSSDSFSKFSKPCINDEGNVAFHAFLDSEEQGIFMGSGETITTIANSSNFAHRVEENFFGFIDYSVNNQSSVVFLASSSETDLSGIFVGSGGSIMTVAEPGTFGFGAFYDLSINEQGSVALTAAHHEKGWGLFTVSEGVVTTLADLNGPFADFHGVSINDQGTVAFFASLDEQGQGIFTLSKETITTIADTSSSFYTLWGYGQITPPSVSINHQGVVAFRAFLSDESMGIFTGTGGATRTIADSSDRFDRFDEPSINDQGTIAFLASLDEGGHGIFNGSDPVSNKIIATGDPLFGSTVVNLWFETEGLNNHEQIAFRADLADGTTGIYRADPVSNAP